MKIDARTFKIVDLEEETGARRENDAEEGQSLNNQGKSPTPLHNKWHLSTSVLFCILLLLGIGIPFSYAFTTAGN